MKIHYLQHVPFEGLGNIETWAIRQKHALSVTRLYLNEPFPPLKDIDWLIVLGGPMNTDEEAQYPWLTQEKQFIKQAIEQDKTVIGICLGSQLIAEALGSSVHRGKYQEIGWFPVELTVDAAKCQLFLELPQKFLAFHWHSDTFNMPQGATHLAYSEACQNQAFIYGNKVLGLQFHLEATQPNVAQMIQDFSNELVEGKYIQNSADLLATDQHFLNINKIMNVLLDKLANQTFIESDHH